MFAPHGESQTTRGARHYCCQINFYNNLSDIGFTMILRVPPSNPSSYLKSVESKWKVKLARRFDRERYVGAKDEVSSHKGPRYILSMFPYPSGKLHLGHVRIYTSADILARFSRMLSKNNDFSLDYQHVINPMGFDSFGLPAENAARERGLNPAAWTNSNIRSMKQQLDDLALQFDWREATSNPNFYKWTQDIYLRLMESGLVYRSYSEVNWDPVDKTVLANEQVDENGRSWRSGALVEKRNYQQWFIKVNAFIKEIYKADEVDPESWRDVLAIQRGWTGKPCGWLFYLPISNSTTTDVLPMFTKHPELFRKKGTKLLLSSDHWLEKVYNISKVGFINNPLNGSTLEVDLTDKIDELPENSKATLRNESNVDENDILSRRQVLLEAKLKGLGGYYTSDRYRDWLVSRQRFWGTPIPTIHCENCGHRGVPRDTLPVKLPSIENWRSNLSDSKSTVVSAIEELAPKDWIETICHECGAGAKRECETFDTLFDSSWYFLRYATSPPNDMPFDLKRVQPVWCYIGGREHAAMHLFYARFITHFLHSQNLLKFKEPFKKLLVQGIVKGKTYKLRGKYLTSNEAESLVDKSELEVEYEKMSKSKGNGVDPQDILEEYGSDATRFCLIDNANPFEERMWRTNIKEFKPVLAFLRRIGHLVQDYCDIGDRMRTGDKTIEIQELSCDDLESKKSMLVEARNKCSVDSIYYIQEAKEFVNFLLAIRVLAGAISANLNNSAVYTEEFAEALASLIVMLNPITPHLSEELWSNFSRSAINPLARITTSRFNVSLQAIDQAWPTPDADYPLQIRVRSFHSKDYLKCISISREEFRKLDENDIARFVESHQAFEGDNISVRKVAKYNDIKAIVTADIESVKRKALDKRLKKKSKTINPSTVS